MILVASAALPLLAAWARARGSTIRHALAWAILAWLAWLYCAARSTDLSRLTALALTGGAGVAVLGARRPAVVAWHFVVATLLLVLGLARAESWLTGGDLHVQGARLIFLAGLIGVVLVNYLPTRYWPGAGLLGVACGLALSRWYGCMTADVEYAAAGLAPWTAWLSARLTREPDDAFDREWRRFRDTFGAVWAQRLREQFNAAARNAKWEAELHWSGLTPTGDATDEQLAALRSLMKRFGTGV